MQLAISLAQRFNGEIINSDALQMYEGLPITTNKLPLEQRKGIPHHLLDCVRLGEETWTVKQFLEQATGIIREIRSRGRLPILVGGTHYYVQSLLFKDALVDEDETENLVLEEQAQKWQVLDADGEQMLEELRKVDPEMAMRWHPGDRRKIRRSLEIWLKTGIRASEIYKKQETRNIDADSGRWDRSDVPNDSDASARVHLRYDTLILWAHAPSDVLNSRLDERVDKMVLHGLLEEVIAMQSFLDGQEQQGHSIDRSRGIWVAIGFKEFLSYIMDVSRPEKLKKEGIERVKIATRQYSKRQVRWIRLRLQHAVNAANFTHKMFLIEATGSLQSSDIVSAKAQDITAAFLNGSELPKPGSLSDTAAKLLVSPKKETKSARYCAICNKTLMFHSEWINHLKGKGHRSSVRPKPDWKKLFPKDNGH